MSVVFYGQDEELPSLLERGISSLCAEESTLMLTLSDGRDLVIWVDDDNDLAMRIEGESVN